MASWKSAAKFDMLMVMTSPPRGSAWRLALSALVLSACGSSNNGARSTPGAPIAATDFAAQAADAYCKSIAHCCSKSSDDCVAKVRLILQASVDSTSGGARVFDPALARACVDAIVALESGALCATWFMSASPSLAPCSHVVDGTVQPGGICGNVTDCRRGELSGTSGVDYVGCIASGTNGDTRCQAFTVPGLNEPCPDGVCQADTYCSAGTCTPARNEGEDCSGLPCVRGYTCTADTQLCAAEPPVPWILDVGFTSTTYACPP